MSALNVPTQYQVFISMMDDQHDHFWRPSGSDKFTTDVADWAKLSDKVKWRIKMCIHLLAHMDIEVLSNLSSISDLMTDAKDALAITFCIDAQRNMENIHTIAYDRIDRELEHPLGNMDISQIKEKVDHISSFSHADLRTQIMAQALAEGVSFVTLFPIFYYLRKKGILPETCTINDEVLRDENLHTRMFITLYDVLANCGYYDRLKQDQAHEMIASFVETEDTIASYIYGDQDDEEKEFFTVMNVENNKTYTRMVANSVTKALGYDILYPDVTETNPFPFVNQSVMDTLVGFFDRDSAEYGIRTDHYYDSDSEPE